MKKAEQRALEAYPPKYAKQKRNSKTVMSEKNDTHSSARTIYLKGYHQAEKDLAMTWEDVRELYIIFAEVDTEIKLCKADDIKAETIGYYQEVLKRFKDFKERKEK